MTFPKRENYPTYLKNSETIGKVGEYYVQQRLAQNNIDSISIDKIYDLFLWESMRRIEIKTAHLNDASKDKMRQTPFHAFQFKEYQITENAFDYAVCIGLDTKSNVTHTYIIPQRYLYLNQQRNVSIVTERPAKRTYSIFEGTSYDKYACCKLEIEDIFTQQNKSAFTRKKNQLTRELINYENNLSENILKVFYNILNDSKIGVRSKNRALANELNVNISSVYKIRERLRI